MSDNKIPTAREFLLNDYDLSSGQEQGKVWTNDSVQKMIEFAKLHVKAALESALEDAPHGSSTDIPSYDDMKDSILNAYPLENIK